MQIAFYASTRTYVGVLEAHGWGETCTRLNEKAAKGDWGGMASLITDEMLDVYAVRARGTSCPGSSGRSTPASSTGSAFYALPGVLPADEGARRALVAAQRSARPSARDAAAARRPHSASQRVAEGGGERALLGERS